MTDLTMPFTEMTREQFQAGGDAIRDAMLRQLGLM